MDDDDLYDEFGNYVGRGSGYTDTHVNGDPYPPPDIDADANALQYLDAAAFRPPQQHDTYDTTSLLNQSVIDENIPGRTGTGTLRGTRTSLGITRRLRHIHDDETVDLDTLDIALDTNPTSRATQAAGVPAGNALSRTMAYEPVLPEDKQIYPSPQSVYGPDVQRVHGDDALVGSGTGAEQMDDGDGDGDGAQEVGGKTVVPGKKEYTKRALRYMSFAAKENGKENGTGTGKAQGTNRNAFKASKVKIRTQTPTRTAIVTLTSTYDHEYMVHGILSNDKLTRSVAVMGHLQCGKTSLLDLMVEMTHSTRFGQSKDREEGVELKYTDTRNDEHERQISIRATPLTLLLESRVLGSENTSGSKTHAASLTKSYGFQFVDTPGHLNFADHMIAPLRLVDGVVLCVDVIEGVMAGTEVCIRQCVKRNVPIVLVLTKMDRLWMEMRVPPQDAYLKVEQLIGELNEVLRQCCVLEQITAKPEPWDPRNNNVCFASAKHGWCASLTDFAELYCAKHKAIPTSPSSLGRRLWGDLYYDPQRRTFTGARTDESWERTFVEFVLNPLYKIYGICLGGSTENARTKLNKMGIPALHRLVKEPKFDAMNAKPMLKQVMKSFLGDQARGLATMIVQHIPSASDSLPSKLDHWCPASTNPIKAMILDSANSLSSSSNYPTVLLAGLVVQVPSLSESNGSSTVQLMTLVRVLSRRIRSKDRMLVLGESYESGINDEDCSTVQIGKIFIPCGRYHLEVSEACAGQLVLVEGIENSLQRGSATAISYASAGLQPGIAPLKPLSRDLDQCPASNATVRIALEPLKPSDLFIVVEALRKSSLLYPSLSVVVEDNGEHAILGTGELFLDCVLYDVQQTFSDIELRLSDPSVPFRESVTLRSSIPCTATSANSENQIKTIAEPLERDLAEKFDLGVFRSLALHQPSSNEDDKYERAQMRIRTEYGWDALSAKTLWAFGPNTDCGPNCLLNDILSSSSSSDDKAFVETVRDSIVQGFQWSVREGPMCDEPVYGVTYRLLDAKIASLASLRSHAQIIPAVRRSCHSAFLTASPCLLEPIYYVQIECLESHISAIQILLQRRRGSIIDQFAKSATPLFVLSGFVPVLDSFGFETDIRSVTNGQCLLLQMFHHWDVLPGNPLDESIKLLPLQVSDKKGLARECMIKTRRRKGLNDKMNLVQYFDDHVLAELLKHEMI